MTRRLLKPGFEFFGEDALRVGVDVVAVDERDADVSNRRSSSLARCRSATARRPIQVLVAVRVVVDRAKAKGASAVAFDLVVAVQAVELDQRPVAAGVVVRRRNRRPAQHRCSPREPRLDVAERVRNEVTDSGVSGFDIDGQGSPLNVFLKIVITICTILTYIDSLAGLAGDNRQRSNERDGTPVRLGRRSTGDRRTRARRARRWER